MKRICGILMITLLLILCAGCSKAPEPVAEPTAVPAPESTAAPAPESAAAPAETAIPAPEAEAESNIEEDEILSEQNPIVTIEMENGGVIKAELYYDVAPNTVKNFIHLANDGFYDGVIFHRVIPGFMIQGGDPTGTGMGGPDYRIKGEFTNNGFLNELSHKRGVLSMARAADFNSAGSQFFIMHADYPGLDKDYASFGMVTEGMDVVDQIATAARDGNDKPKADQRIKTVRVDTFGTDYGEPERIKK